jgi:glycosyltransferase involved in cell wall biosynthesis
MKLLFSAYACAPSRGSEHGLGWNWATEARKLGHEIWALVSPAHHDSIQGACRSNPELGDIRWIFPEVEGWPLKQGIEPKWERTYNLLWQRAALRHARDLHREVHFDAVHHITWAGIRAPTFLGSLGKPLIIGPIGGGEASPRSLRDEMGLRGRLVEAIRDLSTATITLNPIVRPGLNRASVIFAQTKDTKNLFRGAIYEKTVVFSPLSLSSVPDVPRRELNAAPRFLYAGRLLHWKGVHIALRAFYYIVKRFPDARFTVVGDGPEKCRITSRVSRYNLDRNVEILSSVPQRQLFELYDTHDIFLFPSLHDSGGFVVLEALSRGLPVVCLDLGGPRDMVTAGSGIVITTARRNTDQVATAMAAEISRLLDAPQEFTKLSAGAVARAREFILADRVREFYNVAMTFIAKKG